MLTTCVGPMIYFFPAGLKTFLDSLVMLIGLPVLSAVFGGFFFKCLPKYAAKVVFVIHIAAYSVFLITMSSDLHYLYAVEVLWPAELLVMYVMHRRNKAAGAPAWVQEDSGSVDLTPWKYRNVIAAAALICVVLAYIVFSPLGLGA